MLPTSMPKSLLPSTAKWPVSEPRAAWSTKSRMAMAKYGSTARWLGVGRGWPSGANVGACSGSFARSFRYAKIAMAVPRMSSTMEAIDQTSDDGRGTFPASGSKGKFAV